MILGTSPALAACEDLISMSLPSAKVLSANMVAAGATPELCAVNILATPSADSAINIALWMPTAWNGRFEGTGNGGYAGNIQDDTTAMTYAVNHGFAVAASDMGTAPSNSLDGDPLIGHPEKWIDWGYRATHVMTDLSKQVIRAYYNRGPKYSYFNGCSTGGEEALMTAQRYPADYDGILAGSTGHDRTHLHVGLLWIFAQNNRSNSSGLSGSQNDMVTAAAVKACAAESGGLATDAFLTDPRRCTWKPSALLCQNGNTSNCLTAHQVKTVSRIYRGPSDLVTGKPIFPGPYKGSETNWTILQVGEEPLFDSIFKWVFGAQWRWDSFDFHYSMQDMDAVLARVVNAMNPDLSKFAARQGKMIHYHGTADAIVAPQSSIDYYTRVVEAQGAGSFTDAALQKTQAFYRLFMVPGMGHCGGGPGPNSFGDQYGGNEPPSDNAKGEALLTLVRWVEKGTPPTEIIATKYVNDDPNQGVAFQRPLCPYPTFPEYSGQGDPNAASSFKCVKH